MTSTSLADFSSALEKLDATGKNWTTFRQRFQIAVRQKEAWGHLDGTSQRPTPADTANVTPEEQASITAWEKKESLAMYLLTQKLPDITSQMCGAPAVPVLHFKCLTPEQHAANLCF